RVARGQDQAARARTDFVDASPPSRSVAGVDRQGGRLAVMATTRADILAFMRAHSIAVQASVTTGNAPQAAAVGVIVTDAFELFFDTLDSSRKVANLRLNPKVAFVI